MRTLSRISLTAAICGTVFALATDQLWVVAPVVACLSVWFRCAVELVWREEQEREDRRRFVELLRDAA